MARDIFPTLLQALEAPQITPFFAVDLMFEGSYVDPITGDTVTATPLYLWSGYGNFVREDTDNIYLGAGQLLNISTIEETTEIQAVGANFTLSGIKSEYLSMALQVPYHGRECRVYFGVLIGGGLATQGLDTITTQFGDLIVLQSGTQGFLEIFSGEMDQMNIVEAAETATISVSAENALIKLERPVVRRLTSTDQKSRYPSDKGLEYVAGLQDKEIFWGRKGASQ
jgi:hypothetical protein